MTLLKKSLISFYKKQKIDVIDKFRKNKKENKNINKRNYRNSKINFNNHKLNKI
jgi:hypothetical protein